MTSITRRTALTAAPTAPPDSEIMRLFREWSAYRAWYDGLENAGIDDDESDRQTEVLYGIEERIFALPSRDARDVLAKLLVLTLNGEVDARDRDDGPSGQMFAEARALVA